MTTTTLYSAPHTLIFKPEFFTPTCSLPQTVCQSYAPPSVAPAPQHRFRAKREHSNRFYRLLPEDQGQNMALAVFYVSYSLGSGSDSQPFSQTVYQSYAPPSIAPSPQRPMQVLEPYTPNPKPETRNPNLT